MYAISKRLHAPPKFNSSSNSSCMPNLLCPDDVTANGRYGWNENPFTVSKIRLIGLERRNKDSLKTHLETQVQETHTTSCLETCYPLTTLKVIDMYHPILLRHKHSCFSVYQFKISNSNEKWKLTCPPVARCLPQGSISKYIL